MKDLPRLARDIMKKDVVTLEERESLENLEEAMRAMRFRHMPVVEGKRLIGLVTQRDLLRVSASTLLPARREQHELLTKRFTVGDIMMRDVDRDNTLAGIITEADFVELCEQLLTRP